MKTIRERLGITQVALAEALGCTQGNVSFYEKGQMVPPDTAKQLISYARTLGHTVTFDDIYGDAKPSPTAPGQPADTVLVTNPETPDGESIVVAILVKRTKAEEAAELELVERRTQEANDLGECERRDAKGKGGEHA